MRSLYLILFSSFFIIFELVHTLEQSFIKRIYLISLFLIFYTNKFKKNRLQTFENTRKLLFLKSTR